MRGQDRLNGSYRDILVRQEEYGVELVDNSDFLAFTVSDWEKSWLNAGGPAPAWSERMKEYFGEEAPPLRDLDRIEDAMSQLF